jgi:hypothetical protein
MGDETFLHDRSFTDMFDDQAQVTGRWECPRLDATNEHLAVAKRGSAAEREEGSAVSARVCLIADAHSAPDNNRAKLDKLEASYAALMKKSTKDSENFALAVERSSEADSYVVVHVVVVFCSAIGRTVCRTRIVRHPLL